VSDGICVPDSTHTITTDIDCTVMRRQTKKTPGSSIRNRMSFNAGSP